MAYQESASVDDTTSLPPHRHAVNAVVNYTCHGCMVFCRAQELNATKLIRKNFVGLCHIVWASSFFSSSFSFSSASIWSWSPKMSGGVTATSHVPQGEWSHAEFSKHQLLRLYPHLRLQLGTTSFPPCCCCCGRRRSLWKLEFGILKRFRRAEMVHPEVTRKDTWLNPTTYGCLTYWVRRTVLLESINLKLPLFGHQWYNSVCHSEASWISYIHKTECCTRPCKENIERNQDYLGPMPDNLKTNSSLARLNMRRLPAEPTAIEPMWLPAPVRQNFRISFSTAFLPVPTLSPALPLESIPIIRLLHRGTSIYALGTLCDEPWGNPSATHPIISPSIYLAQRLVHCWCVRHKGRQCWNHLPNIGDHDHVQWLLEGFQGIVRKTFQEPVFSRMVVSTRVDPPCI